MLLSLFFICVERKKLLIFLLNGTIDGFLSCGFSVTDSEGYSLIGTGPDAGSEDLQAALREQASQERTSGRAQGDLATCGASRNLF